MIYTNLQSLVIILGIFFTLSIIGNILLLIDRSFLRIAYYKEKHHSSLHDLNIDFLRALELKVDFFYRNATPEQIENTYQEIQNEIQAKSNRNNRSVF